MNQTELKKLLNSRDSRQKYGNHKVHCLSKHLHDSKLEANYCNRLLAMKQNREIMDYHIQVSYDLAVKDIVICRHIVDFKVYFKNGDIECHDTKGVKTPDWIIKRKLFNAIYPQIKYVTIERQ